MKLVSLENITKYNELLNKKIVKSVNSVKPDDDGNILLGTEKSTFNKVEYDTGYFSVGTSKTYTFDLTGSNLENVPKDNINIRLVAKVVTAGDGYNVGDIIQLSPGLNYDDNYGDLDVCSYIRGNTLYVYSGKVGALSNAANNGSHLQKANVQIKAVLTAFVPDDGSILLIAEDQTNTSKLIGLPDGTLTWKDKNLVRSVNDVTADENGNVEITDSGLEIGDIGLAPLGIDETDNCRRYLNGQVILQSQFSKFTEKLKHAITLYPNLATTEQNWQSAVTLSPLGQCGKFVIDDEAGTIRLPKVVNVMGALDLSSIGELQSAGLPNITGNLEVQFISNGALTECGNHALYTYGSSGSMTTGGDGYIGRGIAIDASRSSSIYGNSTTVQQEAIKYPYFIQVATSNSEDVQIDTQVRLNNPFSLFMPYWSPIELNNLSWLRSNKQWNNGSVYTSAYKFLLEKYNAGTEQTETIAGVSVTYKRADNGMKIITDKSVYDALISASGSAFFFVLDTENTQFILPYTNGFAQFGNELGKFTEAGLPNITGSRVNWYMGSNQRGWTDGAIYPHPEAENIPVTVNAENWYEGTVGIKFDASRSSPVYGKSDTVQPNSVTGYLYFYIGEVEQDANIIATSGLATDIANLKSSVVRSVNGVNADASGNVTIKTSINPDYSAIVTKSANTLYTAECDGIVFASFYDSVSSGGSGIGVSLEINGQSFAVAGLNISSGSMLHGSSLSMIVSKGDTYKTNGGTLKFIPFK
jgi:hypothetical protein